MRDRRTRRQDAVPDGEHDFNRAIRSTATARHLRERRRDRSTRCRPRWRRRRSARRRAATARRCPGPAPIVGGGAGSRRRWRDAGAHASSTTRRASTVHGDQPKVMKLLGKTSGSEMMVSAYAKHLAPCFGTVQPEPIAVGARGNASELVSFSGRTLPSISPTQLKQLLTGSKTDPLVKLRTVRDTSIDKLNALAKSDGQQRARRLPGRDGAVADAGARAGRRAVDDAERDHQPTTCKGQALAAAALIRRQRHAGGDHAHRVRRRQPHRHRPRRPRPTST